MFERADLQDAFGPNARLVVRNEPHDFRTEIVERLEKMAKTSKVGFRVDRRTSCNRKLFRFQSKKTVRVDAVHRCFLNSAAWASANSDRSQAKKSSAPARHGRRRRRAATRRRAGPSQGVGRCGFRPRYPRARCGREKRPGRGSCCAPRKKMHRAPWPRVGGSWHGSSKKGGRLRRRGYVGLIQPFLL